MHSDLIRQLSRFAQAMWCCSRHIMLCFRARSGAFNLNTSFGQTMEPDQSPLNRRRLVLCSARLTVWLLTAACGQRDVDPSVPGSEASVKSIDDVRGPSTSAATSRPEDWQCLPPGWREGSVSRRLTLLDESFNASDEHPFEDYGPSRASIPAREHWPTPTDEPTGLLRLSTALGMHEGQEWLGVYAGVRGHFLVPTPQDSTAYASPEIEKEWVTEVDDLQIPGEPAVLFLRLTFGSFLAYDNDRTPAGLIGFLPPDGHADAARWLYLERSEGLPSPSPVQGCDGEQHVQIGNGRVSVRWDGQAIDAWEWLLNAEVAKGLLGSVNERWQLNTRYLDTVRSTVTR